MGAFDKIVAGITQTIKMNDQIGSLAEKITSLTSHIKEVEKEMRDIDKRLIRIEAFVEIAEKQKLLQFNLISSNEE